MTQNTPDYERQALAQLEAADNFRQILTGVYDEKPLDYALIGALKAGIRFSMDAAQIYATLAGHAATRRQLVDLLERDRAALAADRAAGVWP